VNLSQISGENSPVADPAMEEGWRGNHGIEDRELNDRRFNFLLLGLHLAFSQQSDRDCYRPIRQWIRPWTRPTRGAASAF
jgi:hypothetical protein